MNQILSQVVGAQVVLSAKTRRRSCTRFRCPTVGREQTLWADFPSCSSNAILSTAIALVLSAVLNIRWSEAVLRTRRIQPSETENPSPRDTFGCCAGRIGDLSSFLACVRTAAALRASPILALRRRHSSAVEQLFRKSPALCAVLQAWEPDTNGHTYQLFISRGGPPRIDAADRWRPKRLRSPWSRLLRVAWSYRRP